MLLGIEEGTKTGGTVPTVGEEEAAAEGGDPCADCLPHLAQGLSAVDTGLEEPVI